jgi:iron complex outermembrane receptor protein
MATELTLFHISGDNMIETVQIGESRVQNRNVGKFSNKGIEMSFNYLILNNLTMNANYSFLAMEKPVTGAPRNKFYAGMTFRPGKFSIYTGVQIIDKLYLVTGDTPQTSDYTLVDAKIAYHPLKSLDVFVKGDNLLGQKYKTMAGYPMPGATFMGGISIKI